MHCKRETICRGCKYIVGEQHICKHCLVSLKESDMQSLTQGVMDAMGTSESIKEVEKDTAMDSNQHSGELDGNDSIITR